MSMISYFKAFRRVVFICCLSMSLDCFSDEVLKSISEIKYFACSKNKADLPVEVTAQVVRINYKRNNFFIYDGKFGIFVDVVGDFKAFSKLSVGDIVTISGLSNKGDFSPAILAEKIVQVDYLDLPDGEKLHDSILNTPAEDSGWFEVRGRIISATVQPKAESILVVVNRNGVMLNVMLPYSERSEKRLAEIMFESVRFNAVCGAVFNKQRQFVGRILHAQSAYDFEIMDPIRPYMANQITPVNELFRHRANPRSVVCTVGVVTYIGHHELFLRGEGASIRVAFYENPSVSIGDEVKVRGIIWQQPISPALHANYIEFIKKCPDPKPIKVELNGEELDQKFNYDLIEVDATVVEVGKSFYGSDGVSQHTLLCNGGSSLFEVRFPANQDLSPGLLPGAKVRLTGICELNRNMSLPWYIQIDGFSLEVRSSADVVILEKPSWWTVQRLVYLLGIFLGAIALFVVWVMILKRTVNSQTKIIREQVESESILKERQRIARELHDNLAQGLVGMAVHLQGWIRLMDGGFKKIKTLLGSENSVAIDEINDLSKRERQSMQLMQDMLDHCSEESRMSIMYLRCGMSGRMGLFAALEELLEPLAANAGIFLEMRIEGESQSLSMDVERNLMLVVKEAVTNAIRHGEPKNILVVLTYNLNDLIITIENDGKSFNNGEPAPKGHYGLKGMSERMIQMDGSFDVACGDSFGVMVTLKLPIIGLRSGDNE